MELWLSLLLCRQRKTVEWWLCLLMVVVILRPTVADIANVDGLWAHRRHLLRLSPGVDPGPDSILLVLQRFRIFVASALDALVAVLEDDAVFLEKLDPCVIKLVVLVPMFHFGHQVFENLFVDFAYVVLRKADRIVSTTARGKGQGLAKETRHPCWSLTRTFKLPIVVKVLPQRGKLQTDLFFFSWTFSMCGLTFPLCLNNFPHTPHANGFSSVWQRLCVCRGLSDDCSGDSNPWAYCPGRGLAVAPTCRFPACETHIPQMSHCCL